jgi:transketolase C-terminal domain/subunit
MSDRVIVKYDRTDYGRIYLGDVGRRNQLGGAVGLYTHGQDRYLSHGQDATFVKTGDVMMSAVVGTIASMTAPNKFDRTAFTVTF